METNSSKNVLQSVDAALRLIDLFEVSDHLSLTSICKTMGISKSSAFRLCYTLERRGYLVKRGDTSYSLGMRLLTLGNVAKDRMELIPVLRPLLENLMEETEETVHLVVWVDSYRVLLIDHVLSEGPIKVINEIRAPRYPHTTSTGMTLLAAKPDDYIHEYLNTVPLNPQTPQSYKDAKEVWAAVREIRENGYAINNQRYELGLASIAVPIFNRAKTPIAAISISGADTRIMAKKDLIIQKLFETANKAGMLPL